MRPDRSILSSAATAVGRWEDAGRGVSSPPMPDNAEHLYARALMPGSELAQAAIAPNGLLPKLPQSG